MIAAALGERGEKIIDPSERPWSGALGNRQVLLHRQRGKDLALLRHEADAEPGAPISRECRNLMAGKADAAAVQTGMSHDSGEQGRLADAIASQHRECPPRREI